LTNALREAGFDVPVGEERLERAIEQGVAMARRLGRLPKFNDWADARRGDPSLLTEWQVYRMFDARRGAWSTFQYLIRSRLEERGVPIVPTAWLAAGSEANLGDVMSSNRWRDVVIKPAVSASACPHTGFVCGQNRRSKGFPFERRFYAHRPLAVTRTWELYLIRDLGAPGICLTRL
jgi:hypothetical protein